MLKEMSMNEMMEVNGGGWLKDSIKYEVAKAIVTYYYKNPPVIDNSDGIYEY